MFREDALKQRYRPEESVFFESAAPGRNLPLLILLAAFLAIFVFISSVTFAKKESLRGFISPSSGLVRLYAQHPGRVVSVHVSHGEQVTQGQLLITLENDTKLESSGYIEQKLDGLFERKFDHLSNRLTRTDELLEIQLLHNTNQRKIIESQLKTVVQNMGIQKETLKGLDLQSTKLKPLVDSRVISGLSWSNLLLRISEEHQKLNNLQQQELQLRLNLDELKQQQEQIRVANGVAHADHSSASADLLSERMRFISESRKEIRSSVAGRITSLQVSPGEQVRPQQPLLYLLPTGSRLEAKLLATDRALVALKEGQKITFALDAYPVRQHGRIPGEILQIPGNAITVNDHRLPFLPSGPVYLVRAALNESKRYTLLKPDMLLTADVKLEERTLLDWIIRSIKGDR